MLRLRLGSQKEGLKDRTLLSFFPGEPKKGKKKEQGESVGTG